MVMADFSDLGHGKNSGFCNLILAIFFFDFLKKTENNCQNHPKKKQEFFCVSKTTNIF